MIEKRRTAIYASVFKEFDKPKRSIEEQIQFCWNEAAGWDHLAIVGEYTDEVVGDNRPGLENLFAAINNADIDIIMMTDILRLDPEYSERVRLLKRIAEAQIGISIAEHIVLYTVSPSIILAIADEKWPVHAGIWGSEPHKTLIIRSIDWDDDDYLN